MNTEGYTYIISVELMRSFVVKVLKNRISNLLVCEKR